MRVGVYSRVSTANGGQSVEMQLRDLRQLAERRAFEIVKEYRDEGVSGAKHSRPALDAMLADAKRGKFQAILIWKLDRLGRSLAHLVRLLEDFRAWGVELVSMSEGLDFSTATGKLMYQVISAFSEFERDCIRERVRAGLRNARAKGRKLGRPPKVTPDVARIADMRNGGASWNTIERELGVSRRTAKRLMQGVGKTLIATSVQVSDSTCSQIGGFEGGQ